MTSGASLPLHSFSGDPYASREAKSSSARPHRNKFSCTPTTLLGDTHAVYRQFVATTTRSRRRHHRATAREVLDYVACDARPRSCCASTSKPLVRSGRLRLRPQRQTPAAASTGKLASNGYDRPRRKRHVVPPRTRERRLRARYLVCSIFRAPSKRACRNDRAHFSPSAVCSHPAVSRAPD